MKRARRPFIPSKNKENYAIPNAIVEIRNRPIVSNSMMEGKMDISLLKDQKRLRSF
jgi:hypothetical protein